MVLLAAWVDLPTFDNFEVLEFFSGQARISRFCSRQGFSTGCFDIKYDDPNGISSYNGLPRRSAMDMNSPAGFLCLVIASLYKTNHSKMKWFCFLAQDPLVKLFMSAQVGCEDDPGG